jgi:8-oxo-dGTP diphosphatase
MTGKPAAIKTKTSAGGVVYRRKDGNFRVVLIKPARGTVFTLPKGEIDEGESYADTALREVREETGLNAEITAALGSVTYWFFLREKNTKYRKTVHFFLMKYLGGSTEDHDFEVEKVIWIDIDEAMKKVVYRSDIEMLQKAKRILLEE